MKRIKKLTAVAAAVAALLAAGATSANATLIMTIDDGGAGGAISLPDGNGDGIITYTGPIGVWALTVDTGFTKPTLGSAVNPKMILNFSAMSTAADTLTITFAEDGLAGAGFGPLAYSAGIVDMRMNSSSAAGLVNYSTSVNGFVTTAPTQSGAFDNTTYGVASGLNVASWPMSQVITITHGAGSLTTSGDAYLTVVPEPTTMIAGALLLLPFGMSTLRMLRKSRTA